MTFTADQALRLTEILACAGVVLSSLETLARPGWLADSSWNAWPIHRLRYAGTAGPAGRVLDAPMSHPRFLIIVAVRAASALALVLHRFGGPAHALLLGAVALGMGLRALRSPYGGEGSDQVLTIVTVTLLLVAAAGSTVVDRRLGLAFIATQTCLAYFTSGTAKLASEVWRDGTGLAGIFRTRSWGHPVVGRILADHRNGTAWLSRTIVVGEAAFPLILLAPPPAVPYFLAAGLFFHLVCAVAMGLNCFVWAFAATYPAVAYVALGW